MKKTNFRFFKNTPLIDFQNTIHFNNNQERDAFFLEGNHYTELEVQDMEFNFIRQKSTIDIPVSYDDMRGVNYCTFKSEFENQRYYAYVINYEYLNPDTIRVYLLIDGIMTYTQGNTLEQLTNLSITRQHLTLKNYDKHLWELKNNDDILKTNSKSYFHTDRILFDDLLVRMPKKFQKVHEWQFLQYLEQEVRLILKNSLSLRIPKALFLNVSIICDNPLPIFLSLPQYDENKYPTLSDAICNVDLLNLPSLPQ